ncbi:MAG TPA: hypothetical protein VFA68_10615 [Terriglobales bacterium]|nr:hypothetical protein [Terriglobales bacterium]
MKLAAALLALVVSGFAQTTATIPITLDHNRVVIDVRFPLPDGSTKRVRGWVDNGNPEMWITEELAKKLGLEISADLKQEGGLKIRSAPPPPTLIVGGMQLHPGDIKRVKVLVARDAIAPGMSAEINLPSTLLHHYDVQVDYPNREFTIAAPGTLKFQGLAAKATVNQQNGLVQVPAKIDGEDHNLALDVGASYSFVSATLIAKLMKVHPDWPRATGAVGAANMWGWEDEPQLQLLRVPGIDFGGVPLNEVGMASFEEKGLAWFEKRAGVPTAGLLGANAFLGDRVGIDYVHATIYIDKVFKKISPEINVIGLTIRPEPDGRYTVAGVAEYLGKPAVADVKAGDVLLTIDDTPAKGGTMGQVWSLLGGSPGDVRTLTFEREGKPFMVKATVRGFLAK